VLSGMKYMFIYNIMRGFINLLIKEFRVLWSTAKYNNKENTSYIDTERNK